MENLRNKIGSYNKLSDAELDFALQFYEKIEVKKGDYLFKAGQPVNHFFYVEKGCFCFYLLKDGVEQVLEFYTENEVFTDLYAYLESKLSTSFLKATEDSILYRVTKENVERIFNHSHQLERFGRISMQENFLKSFRNAARIKNRSNEERYLRLLKKRPDLFQRVPQYLIASYLGITPVGLSKLRKRLTIS